MMNEESIKNIQWLKENYSGKGIEVVQYSPEHTKYIHGTGKYSIDILIQEMEENSALFTTSKDANESGHEELNIWNEYGAMSSAIIQFEYIEEVNNMVTEKQMEIIRKNENQKYSIDSERYGFNLNTDDYKELTGVDMGTLDKLYGETKVYNEVTYCKTENNFELRFETFVKDSPVAELSGAFTCTDFLNLFADKGNELVITKDMLVNWLKGETEIDGDTLSNVEVMIKTIKEEFTQQWNDYVSDEIIANLNDYDVSEDDVPDTIKEDIAYTYIENYPNESMDKAIENMGTYDMKEHLKDMIDNL